MSNGCIISGADGVNYKRVSRWIKLYPLHDDWGFRHYGKRYRLSQFLRLTYPVFFENKEGKQSFLSAYDAQGGLWPLLLEVDDNGEFIRLYDEIAEG